MGGGEKTPQKKRVDQDEKPDTAFKLCRVLFWPRREFWNPSVDQDVDQDGFFRFDPIFGIRLSIRMSIRMPTAPGISDIPFSYRIIWRVERFKKSARVF
jgi:hypothetical protein